MQAPTAPPTYGSEILDHLGLVAGMYDELEIGRHIDTCIAQDLDRREVSVGQAVKAMVINGLGFVQQSLYLTPRFFKNRPTERLIGEGIEPEHLNDDALGRALDRLYDYGVTELFRDLSAHAATQLGLTPRFAHLDATSFLAHGEYSGYEDPEDGVIQVRKGYSRDRRPDLNQVVLNLVVENRAGLPVLMEPLSGNASDQGSFRELIDRHVDQLLWRPTDSTTWWPTALSTAPGMYRTSMRQERSSLHECLERSMTPNRPFRTPTWRI